MNEQREKLKPTTKTESPEIFKRLIQSVSDSQSVSVSQSESTSWHSLQTKGAASPPPPAYVAWRRC